MVNARLLDADRKPLEVYCKDGEAISKGVLVVRAGGGLMFEPDLLGEGASIPVHPRAAGRGRILDARRKPMVVYCKDADSMVKGTLVMKPGGTILFEQSVEAFEVDDARSAEEDRREARRQARREGTDPREAAPA